MTATKPVFEIENLYAWFGETPVLKNIQMTTLARQITAVIGPSGCGKSTFIRCLNRLHEVIPAAKASGTVRLDGQDIYAPEMDPVLIRRRVGMVFQKANPFPTMSIYENVASGLRLNGLKNRALLDERVEDSLKKAALWDEVKEVLNRSALVNAFDVEIDDDCLRLIALHQPMARDLRFLTTAMKTSTELERMSDLAENISERALELNEEPELKSVKAYADLRQMARYTQQMVKEALDAFVNRNAELARKVCKDDERVDRLNHQIFHELLALMLEEHHSIAQAVRVTFISKYLERVADHATNVSELVVYLIEGKIIRHTTLPE